MTAERLLVVVSSVLSKYPMAIVKPMSDEEVVFLSNNKVVAQLNIENGNLLVTDGVEL